MAITQDQQTDILEIVAGLFNAAPGRAYMTELANIYEGVGSDVEQLADFLDDTPLFQNEILLGRVTTESQVAVLMDHFGLVADDDPASAGSQAEAYFTQKLEADEEFGKIVFDAVTYLNGTPAPEFADTKALLDNKVQVARIYSEDHASTDFAELQSVLTGVSATFPITQADAEEYLESIGQGENPGVTSELTFGADNLVGGAGNDTVTAGVVSNGVGDLVNSLEDVDRVDGGGGRDTLNATLNAAGTTTPSLNSVEVINIRNVTAGATVNFSDTTGAEQIWNNATTAGLTLTYDEAPLAATFGVRNTRSTTNINTFDDASGTDDNLSLAATGAGNDTDSAEVASAEAGLIETLSIAATGENFVDVSAFNAITGLTITGAGSLNAVNSQGTADPADDTPGINVTALETVDASGNTGGVTLDLTGGAVGGTMTVTGGSGNDDITASSGDDTIDVGAGDDRVAFASGGLDDLDTVTGGEGEDTLAFIDGDDFAALDATAHTGFEVLELGALGAGLPVTFDNADFGFTKVVLAEDLGSDLTLDNLGDATLEVKNNQTGILTASSTGAADTFNLLINAEEVVPTVTLPSLDVTDVETVNVSTTADTDDTTLTELETDGVTALTFAGAGDVIITDIIDADPTNNAGTKIASIDLTGQTGGFGMAANSLGYGTTFTLANLGEVAGTAVDFGDGAEEASALFATAGFRDTFQFTTAFTGDVVIDGGQFGGDVTDDRIDLSSFGLTGIDDLTFTDLGANLLIENDTFGGGRILLVGVNGADVNTNDFVF